MKVTFWGTRGSMPISRPEVVRYGGNTSCVQVQGDDSTLLILDGGTGIRVLGETLKPDLQRIDILLTHLHMDHIQGLGFFKPLYRNDVEVHIWGPPSITQDLQTRLDRYFSPPLFPVRVRDLPCRLVLHDAPLGTFRIGGFEIMANFVCHPDLTLGYRITEGRTSLAYLPDHEPALSPRHFLKDPDWTSGFALASGVNLLIHDAQYTLDEYQERVGWGHSTLLHAIQFAAAAGVKRLINFHHDPDHDDATLDKLVEEARGTFDLPFEIVPGRDGMSLSIGERTPNQVID